MKKLVEMTLALAAAARNTKNAMGNIFKRDANQQTIRRKAYSTIIIKKYENRLQN